MSISINQENIEIIRQALNKTKHRVKKLEKKTVGVNENEKNYNYDDSLERLFVITNGQTTRLDEIEERINGIVSLLGINEVPELGDDHDQLINADNEHLNQSEWEEEEPAAKSGLKKGVNLRVERGVNQGVKRGIRRKQKRDVEKRKRKRKEEGKYIIMFSYYI